MVVVVWYLDLQLPVQSVHVTTNVVSSNPVHVKVYTIHHYVIKFVSDLRQVGGYLRLSLSSTNKTYHNYIAEILLKVALNTITLNLLFLLGDKRLQ
jgi:hypothetical protein